MLPSLGLCRGTIMYVGLQLEGVGPGVVVEVLDDDPARVSSHLDHGARLHVDRVDNLVRIFDHDIGVHSVMCPRD